MIPVKITQLSTNKNPIHLTLDVGWVEKYKTVTGNPIVISDGVKDTLLKKLQVTLEPIQSGSGTPSPSNVRPISGWDEVETVVSGKNLLDEETITQGGYESATDQHNCATGYFPIKGGRTYMWSQSGSVPGRYCRFYDSNKVERDTSTRVSQYHAVNATFNTPSWASYVRLMWYSASDITPSDIKALRPMVELGSTATAYEPYQGHTYTTDLPQTVYGGTLDVVSGVLTVDRAMVDMGAVDYAMYRSGFSRARFRTTALETLIKKPPNNNTPVEAISSIFDLVNWGTGNSTNVVGVFGVDTDGDLSVWLNASDYTDATAFKTAMSGQTLVYTLATPTTIQCDPQTVSLLAGENIVMGDGDMEITYRVKASA